MLTRAPEYTGGTEGIDSTNNRIYHSANGLSDGDRIYYDANGGTAISGLTDGEYYFVVGSNSDYISLAATSGGTARILRVTQLALLISRY